MNIFERLFVTIIFIGLSSILLLGHAEGNDSMHTPKGLNQIQNTIEKVAKKNSIDIQIEWSVVKEHEATATMSYKGIEKKIIFNKNELENASQNRIPNDTLNKIYKIISQFPGGDEPPGAPKK